MKYVRSDSANQLWNIIHEQQQQQWHTMRANRLINGPLLFSHHRSRLSSCEYEQQTGLNWGDSMNCVSSSSSLLSVSSSSINIYVVEIFLFPFDCSSHVCRFLFFFSHMWGTHVDDNQFK